MCGININVLFQIKYKYVKNDTFTEYSGKTGLKSDPQYTILVLKLVDQGVEIGKERKQTPVSHSQKGICLQCGNSLIPHFSKASGKKLNLTLVIIRAEDSSMHLTKPETVTAQPGKDQTKVSTVAATWSEHTDQPQSELTVFVMRLLRIFHQELFLLAEA